MSVQAILSPADQYAISRGIVPTGGPIFKEVAYAHETGYAAGFRARPVTAHFPLSGQREFLRRLAPYLAEDITVYHPATGRYGLLRGLPATYEGQGEPLADVEFYADAEAREEGGGDALDDVSKILPVLYSFEDLASEMTLADGRKVVPAVECAEAALLACGRVLHTRQFTAGWAEDMSFLWVELNAGADLICIYADSWAVDINSQHAAPYAAYAKLLAYHFAVGLAPHQYKRKEVANATV